MKKIYRSIISVFLLFFIVGLLSPTIANSAESIVSSSEFVDVIPADKAALEEIKDLASSLQASSIIVESINERSRPIRRIKNIHKLRADFIIRANTVAKPGEKTIFLTFIFIVPTGWEMLVIISSSQIF